jgi:hypothetical protein
VKFKSVLLNAEVTVDSLLADIPNMSRLPNVAIDRLTFLPYIRDISGSILILTPVIVVEIFVGFSQLL